jgi:hypothetical protein
MKVGDKVYLDDDLAVVHTIVFVSDLQDTYLCVYQECSDGYTSYWAAKHRLTPIPKFKLQQVWEMRDGDHGEIVSISSHNMLVVHSKNSNAHGTVGLELNGRYYEAGEESDYDLVRQVR